MNNEAIVCPQCQGKSKKVKTDTIESLVKPDELAALTEREGFRFCQSADCDMVYFNQENGQSILKDQMSVRVGQKETADDRPVCYCFSFSAEDLAAKVRESDTDSIPDYIKAQCKLGKDNCLLNNPQGSCCLGNVRACIKQAQETLGLATAVVAQDDCCGGGTEAACTAPQAETAIGPGVVKEKTGKAGLLSGIGAVGAAIVASACCWLPLLLIAFGVSGTAISASFEAWRPLFLPVTFILLGAAFYFTYRKPAAPTDGGEACCAEDVPSSSAKQAEDCCSVPTSTTTGVKRFNKIMLWPLTVFVVLMAFFPNYVGAFLDDGAHIEANDIAYSFSIEGMTCEACATHVVSELEKVPGVTKADVRYDTKLAHVSVNPNNKPNPESLLNAIYKAGYTGTVSSESKTVQAEP